jgi:putative acetyltransferase
MATTAIEIKRTILLFPSLWLTGSMTYRRSTHARPWPLMMPIGCSGEGALRFLVRCVAWVLESIRRERRSPRPYPPTVTMAPVIESVVIRPERGADHAVVAEVVRSAFVGHPDDVASFVERIRESEEFIPELALVAEDSSGVIGHVVLSWVGVEGGCRTRILNLTPVSVRPDRQRIGVGSRLILDALGRAEEAGEPAVMVEGIAAYYPRFGFERASALGFVAPHPKIPDEAFMVKRLAGYSPDFAGRIVYPAAFSALGY